MNLSEWGSYYAKNMNAVSNKKNFIQLKICIYDDERKCITEDFNNLHIQKMGHNDLKNGSYEISFSHDNFVFSLSFAMQEKGFVYNVKALTESERYRFFAVIEFLWNKKGSVTYSGNRAVVKTDNKENDFLFLGDIDNETVLTTNKNGFLFKPNSEINVICDLADDIDIYSAIEKAKKRYYRQNNLDQVKDATVKNLCWNTVYDLPTKRFMTPVARSWCTGYFGSYILFCWDSFFGGLLYSAYDENLAYLQIYNILDELNYRGMIANTNCQIRKSYDRSHPPVGSFCCYKLYQKYENIEFLKNIFDRLYTWNRWWILARVKGELGLLSLGSDYSENSDILKRAKELQPDVVGELKGAKFESGMDNGTLYDEASYDKIKGIMELYDVGINSLFAMDCEYLAKIADILNKTEEYEILMYDYNRFKELINTHLWCEDEQIYLNKDFKGNFSKRMSSPNFYPLIAGVATEENARNMVEKHLLNEDEFWGEFIIPNTSKKEREYCDDKYWRGKIWPPTNYLVYQGLVRYDLYKNEFFNKSRNMLVKGLDEFGRFGENYNSQTGEPTDTPHYFWSGLLGFERE